MHTYTISEHLSALLRPNSLIEITRLFIQNSHIISQNNYELLIQSLWIGNQDVISFLLENDECFFLNSPEGIDELEKIKKYNKNTYFFLIQYLNKKKLFNSLHEKIQNKNQSKQLDFFKI